MEDKKKWRWGVHRWIVLGLIILNVIAVSYFPPVLPHIQLPAEPLMKTPLFTLPVIGDFYLTNTLVATLLADILLLLLAFSVNRVIASGELIPKGIPGVVEVILEVMYNLTESTAGKWAKKIFPWFAAITLLVWVVNWMELVPGVDSIGILEENSHGYPVKQLAPGVYTQIPKPAGVEEVEDAYALVPFVRVASTDLNFTVALALISVVMTQVMGVRSLGVKYFGKFINVGGLFTKPFFGVIDFGVGFLELFSELSKILSFAFRLFGNIFAGSVLLFVIGTLVPVFAQSIFLMLEFVVGVLQAVIIGMLTMVFMSQAVAGHGEGHEEAEGAH